MRLMRNALAGGLVLSLTTLAGAQEGPRVDWANSWEEAVEEATARNVPIYVTFHMDN